MAIEGTWNVTIKSPVGELGATLELSGSEELTGSFSSTQGDTDVSGKLDGDSLEFSGTMNGPMGREALTFTGTVSGEEISGSVRFGSFGSGSWTASR